jgi:hypothetical protein
MNATELIKFVGARAVLLSNGFKFDVKILDSKEEYHRVDHLVKPISGSGECWVPSWMLEVQEPPVIEPTHTHLKEQKK